MTSRQMIDDALMIERLRKTIHEELYTIYCKHFARSLIWIPVQRLFQEEASRIAETCANPNTKKNQDVARFDAAQAILDEWERERANRADQQ